MVEFDASRRSSAVHRHQYVRNNFKILNACGHDGCAFPERPQMVVNYSTWRDRIAHMTLHLRNRMEIPEYGTFKKTLLYHEHVAELHSVIEYDLRLTNDICDNGTMVNGDTRLLWNVRNGR